MIIFIIFSRKFVIKIFVKIIFWWWILLSKLWYAVFEKLILRWGYWQRLKLVSDEPISFMYLLLGLAVLNIISFVLMYATGNFLGPLPKAIEKILLCKKWIFNKLKIFYLSPINFLVHKKISKIFGTSYYIILFKIILNSI